MGGNVSFNMGTNAIIIAPSWIAVSCNVPKSNGMIRRNVAAMDSVQVLKSTQLHDMEGCLDTSK